MTLMIHVQSREGHFFKERNELSKWDPTDFPMYAASSFEHTSASVTVHFSSSYQKLASTINI